MIGPRMNPRIIGGRGQRKNFMSIPTTANPSTMGMASQWRMSWKDERNASGMIGGGEQRVRDAAQLRELT